MVSSGACDDSAGVHKMMNEDEAYIDDELIDRVEWIEEDGILHDDTWKAWERRLGDKEALHLSEWCRILEGCTKSDLAVATIVAMENYPFMVLQIVAEYLVDKERERKK